jgi:ribosome-associated heat shock protein Hsp15
MDPSATTVRLDVWLDVACLYRTRSEAQRACQGGKVEVNGQSSKPHRLLRVGDEIRLSRPYRRRQTLTVTGLADRHLPKAEARLLYRDTTPQLSEEEKEMRRLERIYRAGIERSRAPDKRERRALRKLKGH